MVSRYYKLQGSFGIYPTVCRERESLGLSCVTINLLGYKRFSIALDAGLGYAYRMTLLRAQGILFRYVLGDHHDIMSVTPSRIDN